MDESEDAQLFALERKRRSKPTPAPDNAVHRLIAIWVGLFRQRFRERPIVTPKDGAALKRLLVQTQDEAVIARRLPLYFDLDDAYLQQNGFPLAQLPASWNRLIAIDAQRTQSRVPDADATERYLRKLRQG
jgi:hypothetical protein